MKTISCLVLLGFMLHSNVQAQMVPFISRSEFNWSPWESTRDDKEKAEWIAKLGNFENSGMQLGTEFFKIIDLDADGNPDIVYNGPFGDSQKQVLFFLFHDDSFEKVFQQPGELIYISRDKPWNPISFQVVQKVSDENSELQICSHSFQGGQLQFVLNNTIILQDDMKVVKENLPPMLFEVGEEVVHLHTAPGNSAVIKDYELGDIGFAIASQMNGDGEIWWFVFMKENHKKLRAGWINSHQVHRL